jgi:GNAT superfamily N-acetyltransferase
MKISAGKLERGIALIQYTTSLPADIDWDAVATIFERAPLGSRRRDPNDLQQAFAASYAVVYAYDGETLIGLARALCDGVYQAAIYDVVLLPEYQGKGIGKAIMEHLCRQLPVDNIILYAVPGREGFYARCGFVKMRTAMAVLNPNMARPETGYLDEI